MKKLQDLGAKIRLRIDKKTSELSEIASFSKFLQKPIEEFSDINQKVLGNHPVRLFVMAEQNVGRLQTF